MHTKDTKGESCLMNITNSIQDHPRWVTYGKFCEMTGIKLRTAKAHVSQGKLKIKPKQHKSGLVLIDWWDFCKD